jgi:SseB protein N-terminal domain
MDSARATLPSDVLLLPILPPTLDEHDRPVGEVQVQLARTPDGTVIAEAYTSPQRLVTARGNLQPWAAIRRQGLADLLDEQEVGRLLVDPGSPDGYAIDRDGTRTPLSGPQANASAGDSTSGREVQGGVGS